MRAYRHAIIGSLVAASVAFAFLQIDDTDVQTILTGAIKTFQDAIRFQATGGGTNYVGIVAPATVPTSTTYKLPSSDGTSGQSLVTDGSANLTFASVGGSVATPTPLAFGTPPNIAVFNATNLGTYPGSACTPPALALSTNSAGVWTCATPAAVTPVPTDTPLIDLSYSGKLNLGASVSGTPLGAIYITTSATPAPHDRVVYCDATSGNVTYTLPPATKTGRIIDMIRVDGSGNTCILHGAGSDFLNDAHLENFISKWQADTCQDDLFTTAQWACRAVIPTATPTSTPTNTPTP